jgi:hypothetical protein
VNWTEVVTFHWAPETGTGKFHFSYCKEPDNCMVVPNQESALTPPSLNVPPSRITSPSTF